MFYQTTLISLLLKLVGNMNIHEHPFCQQSTLLVAQLQIQFFEGQKYQLSWVCLLEENA